MVRRRRWLHVALGLLGIGAATTTTDDTCAECVGTRQEQVVLELESLTIDGVAEPDRSAYQDWHVSLAAVDGDGRLRLSAFGPDSDYFAEEYVP
jgi:hypothetical protein